MEAVQGAGEVISADKLMERKVLIDQCLSFCRQPREADIVCRSYGVGMPKQTLNEIAADYSLTPERIRQIKMRALRRMKAGAARDAKLEERERILGL